MEGRLISWENLIFLLSRGVECHNDEEGARCGPCPAGTVGDGVVCGPPEDPCVNNPCYQGVTCLNLWMGRSAGFVCGPCPDSMVSTLYCILFLI